MVSRRIGTIVVALGALIAATFPALPGIAAEDQAGRFVQTLADRVTNMFGDGALTRERRDARFRNLLETGFDMNLIGRVALDGRWPEATAEQHSEYLALFSDYVVKSHGRLIGAYAAGRLEVVRSTPIDDLDTMVQTRISRASGTSETIEWRVRRSADGLRVIDVIVKGVSMLNTQRAEFGAVIDRDGIDGLLEALRDYTAK